MLAPTTPLAALIAAQTRDDAAEHLRTRKREVRASDLATASNPTAGWDYLADAVDHREPTVLVGSSKIWGAAEAAYVPTHGRCPACGDQVRPGPGLHFCLCCSTSSRDGRQWPAQAPPARLRRRRA